MIESVNSDNNTVLMSKKRIDYYPSYNGDQNYRVRIFDDKIELYIVDKSSATYDELDYVLDEFDNDKWIKYFSKLVYTIRNFQQVFVPSGTNRHYDFGLDVEYIGNSILIKDDAYNYTFICLEIVHFKTCEEITEYMSVMSRSYVNLPYALGAKFAYFPADDMYLLRSKLDKDNPESSYFLVDEKYFNKLFIVTKYTFC